MAYYSVKKESALNDFCKDLSEPFKFKDFLQHLTKNFFCVVLETYPNLTLEDIIIIILNQLTIQVFFISLSTILNTDFIIFRPIR